MFSRGLKKKRGLYVLAGHKEMLRDGYPEPTDAAWQDLADRVRFQYASCQASGHRNIANYGYSDRLLVQALPALHAP